MKLSFIQATVAFCLVATLTSQVVVGDVILLPTDPPTDFPTDNPTDPPTKYPTTSPTISKAPTKAPTKKPTLAPTESQNPTESPGPTMYQAPPAPTCPKEDNGDDYYPRNNRDYFSKSFFGYSFKVDRYCLYQRSHAVDGYSYYNTVIEFITSAAVVNNGWLYDNGASLSGQLPDVNDVEVVSDCDGVGSKTCISLKSTSAGTSGGAVSWIFHTEDEALAFKEFFDSFVRYGGAAWVTHNKKMCGKNPFCWDGTGGNGYGWYYGRCSVSREVTSGHCGEYDFLIDGDLSLLPNPPFYERCGDPWKWFQACIATWECQYLDEGTFQI